MPRPLVRLWSCVFVNIATAVECDFKRFLVQYAYVAVRDDKKWQEVAMVAEFAPLLTALQSKLLSLVIMLVEAEDPEMRDHYQSLPDEFMAFIRHRLFAEECYFSYKQCQLANICRGLWNLFGHMLEKVFARLQRLRHEFGLLRLCILETLHAITHLRAASWKYGSRLVHSVR